jgi:hypothetical protein
MRRIPPKQGRIASVAAQAIVDFFRRARANTGQRPTKKSGMEKEIAKDWIDRTNRPRARGVVCPQGIGVTD